MFDCNTCGMELPPINTRQHENNPDEQMFCIDCLDLLDAESHMDAIEYDTYPQGFDETPPIDYVERGY